uniref:Basic secretory protease n=1 Tax=Oryza punctata TaxID=4537 RepID=A0A0E0M939_ORYPU
MSPPLAPPRPSHCHTCVASWYSTPVTSVRTSPALYPPTYRALRWMPSPLVNATPSMSSTVRVTASTGFRSPSVGWSKSTPTSRSNRCPPAVFDAVFVASNVTAPAISPKSPDMKLHVAAALLLAVTASSTAGAVTYEVNNEAASTAGGQRFDREYGADYAKQVLADASSFTWNIFNQPSAADRSPVDTVVLAVRDVDGIASTLGNTITLGAGYVAGITGNDFNTQVTGVLYHEVVHVWQWGLQDYAAHSWVYEGIADFVRLRAGYIAAGWVQPGQGNSWEDSYSVTARFFDYCDSVKPGFVADLNGKLKDGYNVDYFVQITGKTVQQLWQDYKAKYGN